MRAILKYPWSKWGIARWIIDFFPEHHSYLEPFFGSGAVLFNKPRSNIETVNDLDGQVVNLFEWVKKDPERLAREIYYTPYSREVYELTYNHIPSDSLQQAVNFFIQRQMARGFRTNGEKEGWKIDIQGRERAYAAKDWTELPEAILAAAERLRGVQIEHRPAIDLIRAFNSPKTLIYADPPYLLHTRHGKQYREELTYQDHEELLEALKAHKGPVLVSGYESDLYNTLLQGWHKETIESYTQSITKKTEVLWMNFIPDGRQMEIWEMGV